MVEKWFAGTTWRGTPAERPSMMGWLCVGGAGFRTRIQGPTKGPRLVALSGRGPNWVSGLDDRARVGMAESGRPDAAR